MKRHLKRISAPRTWSIKRKENVWITRQNPGPHNMKNSIPLNVIFKDILKYTKTTRETKRILSQGNVFVNGKARKNVRFSVGPLDVLSLPTGENFRLLYNKLGKFVLVSAGKDEGKRVLYKIKNKVPLKNKKIQLNFSEGSNIIVDKDTYSTGDTLVLEGGKIKEHVKFEDSASIYAIGGKHIGAIGSLKKIDNGYEIKTKHGSFKILKEHVFVIGKDKPLFNVKEENESNE